LHKALALTQVSLLTLEERLINQEKLSYNGQLLWKITNVNERIQEAKSGRQTSFYSPPFRIIQPIEYLFTSDGCNQCDSNNFKEMENFRTLFSSSSRGENVKTSDNNNGPPIKKLSYNGQLLWKITNVNERMQEAKSGRKKSFYSSPFYTDGHGFKMCARMFLNGDGNGRGTHLSLFFVILRGEYDALLKWPFTQKVTFTLVDQSELKEHVIDAFRPDPNHLSFQRPVSEWNVSSGLPIFCPLGKLRSTNHEYIKDNTMYIEIVTNCVNSTI
jgi:hypothetical protein